MPRGHETRRHAIAQSECLVERDRLEAIERSPGIGHRIKRQRIAMPGKGLAPCVLRFLLLEVPAVRQEQAAQLDGRRRGIYRPAEAISNKCRQVARMVDMRMGKQHIGDALGWNGERIPVA